MLTTVNIRNPFDLNFIILIFYFIFSLVFFKNSWQKFSNSCILCPFLCWIFFIISSVFLLTLQTAKTTNICSKQFLSLAFFFFCFWHFCRSFCCIWSEGISLLLHWNSVVTHLLCNTSHGVLGWIHNFLLYSTLPIIKRKS